MVIILDRNLVSSVYFPKNIPNSALPSTARIDLEIYSELTHYKLTTGPEDLKSASNIVYKFNLSNIIGHLKDGEYNYSIIGVNEGEKINLSKGLMRIGKLEYNPKKDENKAKKIIQYGE